MALNNKKANTRKEHKLFKEGYSQRILKDPDRDQLQKRLNEILKHDAIQVTEIMHGDDFHKDRKRLPLFTSTSSSYYVTILMKK